MSLPYNHTYMYPPYKTQPSDQQYPQGYSQISASQSQSSPGPPYSVPTQMHTNPNPPSVPYAYDQPPPPDSYPVDDNSQSYFLHQQHQYQQHLQQHPSQEILAVQQQHQQPVQTQQHQQPLQTQQHQQQQPLLHHPQIQPMQPVQNPPLLSQTPGFVQSRAVQDPPVLYPPNVQIPIEQPIQQPVYNSYNYSSYNYNHYVPPYPAGQPYRYKTSGPSDFQPSSSGPNVGSLGSIGNMTMGSVGSNSMLGSRTRSGFQNPKVKSEPVLTQISGHYDSPGYGYSSRVAAGMNAFGYSGYGSSLIPNRPTSINHFKPIETKKNSKPRINKIIKNVLKSPSLPYSIGSFTKKKTSIPKLSSVSNRKQLVNEALGELSIDALFEHFSEVMKIESPRSKLSSTNLASYQINLKNDLECQLFDLFVNSLSKFIDIFLPKESFKKIIPELALYDDTNMILDSMFCLSSLILQRISPERMDPSIPIKYYQQAVKSIRSYLSIPGIENNENGIISRCLLSTIILCVYELFFVAIDSTYVKGASSILSSVLIKYNNNPKQSLLKNSPFHQTCFWAMYICDMILSHKFNLPSMYSIETFWKPLDPEYFDQYNNYCNQLLSNNVKDREIFINNSMLNKEHTLWWLHKSLINYSAINEFYYHVDVITEEDYESNKPFNDWVALRNLVDEFESNMPINLKPTIYKPSSMNRVFPLIYFKDEVTAIIGLNFKLSKIALYESLISRTNPTNIHVKEELAKYPDNYVKKLTKDIIGIMKTYDGNLHIWPVNVHTLRKVAHYLFDEPDALELLEELVERVVKVSNLHLRDKIVPF